MIVDCVSYLIGMDYRTLRDELQAGSRLPNPTYSTPEISHLIQTCWLADPMERPTFTKLKERLMQSGRSGFDKDKDNTKCRYLCILPDSSMYKQYKMIQECNPLFKTNEDLDTDDSLITIQQISSLSASPCDSNLYSKASTSSNTAFTNLNSTSTYQNSVLSYMIPRDPNYSFRKNEDRPLLGKTHAVNEDDIIDEVFLYQLD